MRWYPSVENFTKIMIAHLETLMYMMYTLASNSEGRTAKELGVNVGPDGDCSDVNSASEVIPPFPRVTRHILGDDNVTKFEDTWVGEYDGKGSRRFEEVDFINGLFNAIERIKALQEDTESSAREFERANQASEENVIIKHPLSSFDFYISKSPYGNPSEISNDVNGYDFAGKVAIRMFDIFSVSSFKDDKNIPLTDIETIAKIEADNFHETTPIANDKFLTAIRDNGITSDKLFDIITKANKPTSENDTICPWGETPLFSSSGGKLWLTRYYVTDEKKSYVNGIYPIQDMSFSKINEAHSALNQGKMVNGDGTLSLFSAASSYDAKDLGGDKYGFGNVMICDDMNRASEILNDANSSSDDDYTPIYEAICKSAELMNPNMITSQMLVVQSQTL